MSFDTNLGRVPKVSLYPLPNSNHSGGIGQTPCQSHHMGFLARPRFSLVHLF
jgi:hypothetical protein